MTRVSWLQLVLGILTVYRLCILVTRDTVPFGPARDWLTARYRGRLVELVQCTWCLGMWFAAGLWVLNLYYWGNVWLVSVEVIMSFSAAAGFLSELA